MLVLTIPLVLLFSTYLFNKTKSVEDTNEQHPKSEIKDVFDHVEIAGRAAVVKDVNTEEILYAKNADISLPLASITKILTILTVDKLNQKEIVKINLEDLLAEGDNNLLVGENFKIQDLIDLTLAASSNDGTKALTSSVINAFNSTEKIDFIEEMNKLAQEIGMSRSRFYNETGLDENENRAGAYGSANDIAKLFEYALKNRELISATSKNKISVKSFEGFIHDVKNTNEIIDQLPNVLASKTGYTDIAGGNLAVVIDPFLNRPIVIVVLGSTSDGRFEDVKTLAQKTIEYFINEK